MGRFFDVAPSVHNGVLVVQCQPSPAVFRLPPLAACARASPAVSAARARAHAAPAAMDALNVGAAAVLRAAGVDAAAATKAVAQLNAWRYTPGVTPFSHWGWTAGATLYYVVMYLALQRVMVKRKPVDIPRFLFVHNMALCVASLGLGLWLTYILLAQLIVEGLSPFELICARRMHENGHLHAIYYINSAFKFWEFTDTFLLLVRKKPVAFLHSYHHAATLVLTYVQLVEHSTAQWVPIVLNLWVHVFMYYYYAMSALGVRVWWKKHLTTLQIAQFVIDIVVIGYAYAVFIGGGFSEDACYGTSKAAVVGGVILASYLVLFVRFFFQTYKKSAPAASKKEL